MTGSYFRGDAVPVLAPDDEAKFETVTYTYYEQLNGYEHLKSLDIGYYFYSGRYLDAIMKVLDPALKTIVHIPNVNSRESTKDKIKEANEIMDALGDWQGEDPATGFHLIKRPDGRILKNRRSGRGRPGQARQGRQRAQRPGAAQQSRSRRHHSRARHGEGRLRLDLVRTRADGRLPREPDRNRPDHRPRDARRAGQDERALHQPDRRAGCFEEAVVDAVNDTLKAIAASLLMEQVLAPRFISRRRIAGPQEGYDYGAGGYDPNKRNVGFNEARRANSMWRSGGLSRRKVPEATRICREDINEVIAAFVQDRTTVERGLFDEETAPAELTQMRMGMIVRDVIPISSETDQEAVRQHAVAALNLTQQARAPRRG